ncbi:uncharacterized protein MELLADRAFT_58653 [Melampsora larici-populina 98AG31]|uniref:Uncharacterized protein n=1 Tax=Melampsora larici-populina (strain 98AG31 / pathotype 3-4-7) TaxID=747676 RepID=F4R4C4_MELLP|nr:uncharacterized protein MELLADRAFT_58653 [Melampsora larici-populina 98AG31]EGG12787.1 hypothetical protein MELLADRAFT_58653 [Melampsora larici-populina 98AG31]
MSTKAESMSTNGSSASIDLKPKTESELCIERLEIFERILMNSSLNLAAMPENRLPKNYSSSEPSRKSDETRGSSSQAASASRPNLEPEFDKIYDSDPSSLESLSIIDSQDSETDRQARQPEGQSLLATAFPLAHTQVEIQSRQMQTGETTDHLNNPVFNSSSLTQRTGQDLILIKSVSPDLSSNQLFRDLAPPHLTLTSGASLESAPGPSQITNGPIPPSVHPDGTSFAPQGGLVIPAQTIFRTSDGKIQFHNTVRISGGLASKPKIKAKAKSPSLKPPSDRRITPDRKRSMVGKSRGSTSPSPLRNVNGDFSGLESRTIDRRAIQPSSSRSTISTSPGHQSLLSRSQPRSPPPYPASMQRSHLTRHPSGSASLRRPSLSDSISGSFMASTIASRSTSPASSIYAPLRVPHVRAPAPFFGPTPERVARVRERRKVAERNAERAKGGWKAWWNNWFHQSDDSTLRKGKMASGHHHEHHHCPNNNQEVDEYDEDSDDGSCYHDVVLEHERSKLERRLKKLDRAANKTRHLNSSSHSSHPKITSRSVDNSGKFFQGWSGRGSVSKPTTQASSHSDSPTPVQPLRGILHNNVDPSSPNAQTPLLGATRTLPRYLNQDGTTTLQSPPPPKTETDVRFGKAPGRWFKLSWMAWKIKTIVSGFFKSTRDKFVDLFHVDWDTDDEHYEGWENV